MLFDTSVSDIPNNPFSPGFDGKQIVEQPPLINSDNDMLSELNPIVKQTTETNVHFARETNIIPGDELVHIEEVPSISITRTIDVDDFVSQTAQVDETGTKEIAASSVKTDSIPDSGVKSEPEIKNVLTPEEIVQKTTIKKLKDSLENIPTDVIKKKEFIKEFLLTSLKTGKQLEITPNSFFEKSFNDSIKSLLALNSSDVPLVLESWLDVSILQNRDNIYCSSIYDPNKFIKTCKD